MQKIFSIILRVLLLLAGLHVYGQDATPVLPAAYTVTSNNYIRTWIPNMPQTNAANITVSSTIPAYSMTTQYYDGLGRPVQTVVKQGSMITGATAADMVSPVVYDDYGREVRKYLPFTANTTGGNTSVSDGLFKLNPFAQQQYFYSNSNPNSSILGQGETFYYGKTDFEPSPLNRINKTYAPGNSWVNAGKSVKMQYWTNTLADSVRIFTITDVTGSWGTYTAGGIYAAGELTKNVVVDEHDKQVIEFTDKLGRMILRKVQLTATADTGTGSGYTGWLCTYYLYDARDLQRAVIQPKGVDLLRLGSWTFTTNLLDEFCFRYEYDGLQHLIMKKVPGAGDIHMVYDARDRLVLSQDANQRTSNQWLVTKYDAIDRTKQTWLWTSATTRPTHATSAKNSVDYPTAAQLSGATMLTETYYDDYSWVPAGIGLSSTYLSSEASSGFLTPSDVTFPYPRAMTAASTLIRGQVTGSKTLVLGTTTYLYTVLFYDDKARVIQTLSKNITGGVDKITTQYSFNGQPLVTKYNHTATGTIPGQVIVITRNEYDSLWRLLNVYKKIDSGAEKWIIKNEYDALGKLKRKSLSPSALLDTLTYTYNIRGWLTGINKAYANGLHTNNWFGLDLSYDHTFSAPGGGTNFNRNISAAIWRSKNDNEQRSYAYSYDAANRLLKAQFTQYTSGWNTSAGKDYTAVMGDGVTPSTAYDANGNILKMTHYTAPATKIDELIYNYNYVTDGNKLWRVTDNYNNPSSTLGDFKEITSGQNQDYTYDNNGSMTADNNKGISSITYNHLNQPLLITITGKGTIGYTYDATGNKLKEVITDNTNSTTTTTKYIGGFQYRQDTLLQFGHDEGRVRRKPDGSYVYDYYEKDQLGSVRVTLTEETTVTAYLVASMEPENAATENTYYYNIEETRAKKPLSYPQTDSTNRYAAKLDGDQKKTGPYIILKVNAGDTLNIRVNSWYQYNSNQPRKQEMPLEELAVSMAGAGIDNVSKVASTATSVANPLAGAILSLLKNRPTEDPALNRKPKAYLNWILLDEDLKPIPEDTTLNPFDRKEYSGFQRVGAPGELTQHVKQGWKMEKSGFVYIFTSNESPDADVYFDDLAITTFAGPLLEVNHTYPFGLTIAGISSYTPGKLENKKRFNGNELKSREFSDGSGLELFDFNARMYDSQRGEFIQMDPWIEVGRQEMLSPYQFSYNNPVRYNDPDGKCPLCLVLEVAWDVYTAYKVGKTAVAAVSIVQEGAINGFQPGNGMNSPVSLDNTAVAKNIPTGTLSSMTLIPSNLLHSTMSAQEVTASKDNSVAPDKKVPNPNGKKGGKDHQEKIQEQEKRLEKEGYDQIENEVRVSTPNGDKKSRYIDVRGTKTETGETKDIQVGKQNKNGTPVSREQRALKDIEEVTNQIPEFIPYNIIKKP